MSGGQTLAGAPAGRATAADDLAPGMRMGTSERYELVDKVGQGGMGSVWRAKDLSLDGRIVAMKRLLLLDEADRHMLERFEQERSTIAGLNHANVVTVFDAGSDDWGPYLVMEYVEGQPLDHLLKRETLAEQQAVAIFEGLCRGVAHAHKKGVIHRDIKPANVILDSEGTPKLLDFGLARGAAGLELSMTGYGMGTLDYAAPEQKRDAKSVNHRADIYALGATFYELLTGLKPVPLLVAKVPTRWQALLGKLCEPDPKDRYQTVSDVLGALDEARHASTLEGLAAAGPDEDDLSCPSCKRMNALDARFCRGCGEGLQAACPACEAEYRVGLRHCDKCGASVEAIREGKARLEAAQEALKATRLGVAQREAADGQAALKDARLGSAESVLDELKSTAKQAAEQESKAKRLLKKAKTLEVEKDYKAALRKLKKAAALYDTHSKLVDEAGHRFHALLRERDMAVREGKARLEAAREALVATLLEVAQREAADGQKALEDMHLGGVESVREELGYIAQQVAAQESQAQRLLDGAESLEARMDYEAALEKLREAVTLYGTHSKLVDEAEQRFPALIGARDGARKLAEARSAEANADYEAALELFAEAAECDTTHHAAHERAKAVLPAWIALMATKTDLKEAAKALSEGKYNKVRRLLAAAREVMSSGRLQPQGASTSDQEAQSLGHASSQLEQHLAPLEQQLHESRATADECLEGIRKALEAGDLEKAHIMESRAAPWWPWDPRAADLDAEYRRQTKQRYRTYRRIKNRTSPLPLLLIGSLWPANYRELRNMIERGDDLERKARALHLKLRITRALLLSALLAFMTSLSCNAWRVRNEVNSLETRIAAAVTLESLHAIEADSQGSTAWPEVRENFGARAGAIVDALLAGGRPLTAEMVDALLAGGRPLTTGMVDVLLAAKGDYALTSSCGAKLLAVPSGAFEMGSNSGDGDEKPIHTVILTKAFFLGETEVTQAQWESVMGSNPTSHKGGTLPVAKVSRADCEEFCRELTARDRASGKLPAGWKYTLPTEAQWEYACRAGMKTNYCFGNNESRLGDYGWYGSNSGNQTHLVRGKKPNPWGFYDMHGNVWEWCLDWYDAGFYGTPNAGSDPLNSTSASYRVRRGGGYRSDTGNLRSANRDYSHPSSHRSLLGFRLAMVTTE